MDMGVPLLFRRSLAVAFVLAGCTPGRALPDGGGDERDLTIVFADDGPAGGCSDSRPCGNGQRCLDGTCVADNGVCTSDDQCENDTWCNCTGGGGTPDDAGPCLNGICVPWGPPRGPFDPDCQTVGFTPSQFAAPKLKCSWTGSGVMSSPLVADLDGDGRPEIIAETLNNTIVALRGRDCSVLFEKNFVFAQNEGHLAIADLDGDHKPEIVAFGSGNIVTVLDNKGNVLATSPVPFRGGTSFGGPAIADVDNQAPPEILAPGQVVRYRKGDPMLTVLWTVDPGLLADGLLPLAADFDGDGRPEVVEGRVILDGITGADKTPPNLKAYPATGAFSAVGDFNGDKKPDLVVVQSFGGPVRVTVHDVMHDVIIFGPYLYDGQRMGPPTVADFDGDGRPEFATAGADAYRVFSFKCVGHPRGCAADGVLWSKTTQDKSSGVTGSSVFDFNGDGKAEVVYRDECWLRVYNGPDGKTLFATAVSSFTALELPVIADVDNDGHADIAVSADSTQRQCSGNPEDETMAVFDDYRAGIYVYQDPKNRWMPSRGLWNQHTYHITNINDDLTVPRVEKPNWLTLNNYRQNVQGMGGRPLAIGDATAGVSSGIDNGQADCMVAWTLRASFCNRGSADLAAGAPGTFYPSDPRQDRSAPICTAVTSAAIAPGSCEVVHCDWLDPPQEAVDLWFRANDDGMGNAPFKECKQNNDLLFMPQSNCRKIM